jgi:hypothetical protein
VAGVKTKWHKTKEDGKAAGEGNRIAEVEAEAGAATTEEEASKERASDSQEKQKAPVGGFLFSATSQVHM